MKRLPPSMICSKYAKPGMKGYIEVLQERQRALALRQAALDTPGCDIEGCQDLYDGVQSDIDTLNQMRADGFFADQNFCNCVDSDGGEWFVDWASYWNDKRDKLQHNIDNINQLLTDGYEEFGEYTEEQAEVITQRLTEERQQLVTKLAKIQPRKQVWGRRNLKIK